MSDKIICQTSASEGQQDNECVEMFHTYIHTCDISCSVYRLIADCVFTFSR